MDHQIPNLIIETDELQPGRHNPPVGDPDVLPEQDVKENYEHYQDEHNEHKRMVPIFICLAGKF
ncbi:MAG: hypothetical protein NTV01_15285 [Bacteroidia bacterium]|nr:hypothetical protein [Bacteroidia bacterium]